MLKADNLLSGYPFTGYKIIRIPTWLHFRFNDFTEVKSNHNGEGQIA